MIFGQETDEEKELKDLRDASQDPKAPKVVLTGRVGPLEEPEEAQTEPEKVQLTGRVGPLAIPVQRKVASKSSSTDLVSDFAEALSVLGYPNADSIDYKDLSAKAESESQKFKDLSERLKGKKTITDAEREEFLSSRRRLYAANAILQSRTLVSNASNPQYWSDNKYDEPTKTAQLSVARTAVQVRLKQGGRDYERNYRQSVVRNLAVQLGFDPAKLEKAPDPNSDKYKPVLTGTAFPVGGAGNYGADLENWKAENQKFRQRLAEILPQGSKNTVDSITTGEGFVLETWMKTGMSARVAKSGRVVDLDVSFENIGHKVLRQVENILINRKLGADEIAANKAKLYSSDPAERFAAQKNLVDIAAFAKTFKIDLNNSKAVDEMVRNLWANWEEAYVPSGDPTDRMGNTVPVYRPTGRRFVDVSGLVEADNPDWTKDLYLNLGRLHGLPDEWLNKLDFTTPFTSTVTGKPFTNYEQAVAEGVEIFTNSANQTLIQVESEFIFNLSEAYKAGLDDFALARDLAAGLMGNGESIENLWMEDTANYMAVQVASGKQGETIPSSVGEMVRKFVGDQLYNPEQQQAIFMMTLLKRQRDMNLLSPEEHDRLKYEFLKRAGVRTYTTENGAFTSIVESSLGTSTGVSSEWFVDKENKYRDSALPPKLAAYLETSEVSLLHHEKADDEQLNVLRGVRSKASVFGDPQVLTLGGVYTKKADGTLELDNSFYTRVTPSLLQIGDFGLPILGVTLLGAASAPFVGAVAATAGASANIVSTVLGVGVITLGQAGMIWNQTKYLSPEERRSAVVEMAAASVILGAIAYGVGRATKAKGKSSAWSELASGTSEAVWEGTSLAYDFMSDLDDSVATRFRKIRVPVKDESGKEIGIRYEIDYWALVGEGVLTAVGGAMDWGRDLGAGAYGLTKSNYRPTIIGITDGVNYYNVAADPYAKKSTLIKLDEGKQVEAEKSGVIFQKIDAGQLSKIVTASSPTLGEGISSLFGRNKGPNSDMFGLETDAVLIFNPVEGKFEKASDIAQRTGAENVEEFSQLFKPGGELEAAGLTVPEGTSFTRAVSFVGNRSEYAVLELLSQSPDAVNMDSMGAVSEGGKQMLAEMAKNGDVSVNSDGSYSITKQGKANLEAQQEAIKDLNGLISAEEKKVLEANQEDDPKPADWLEKKAATLQKLGYSAEAISRMSNSDKETITSRGVQYKDFGKFKAKNPDLFVTRDERAEALAEFKAKGGEYSAAASQLLNRTGLSAPIAVTPKTLAAMTDAEKEVLARALAINALAANDATQNITQRPYHIAVDGVNDSIYFGVDGYEKMLTFLAGHFANIGAKGDSDKYVGKLLEFRGQQAGDQAAVDTIFDDYEHMLTRMDMEQESVSYTGMLKSKMKSSLSWSDLESQSAQVEQTATQPNPAPKPKQGPKKAPVRNLANKPKGEKAAAASAKDFDWEESAPRTLPDLFAERRPGHFVAYERTGDNRWLGSDGKEYSEKAIRNRLSIPDTKFGRLKTRTEPVTETEPNEVVQQAPLGQVEAAVHEADTELTNQIAEELGGPAAAAQVSTSFVTTEQYEENGATFRNGGRGILHVGNGVTLVDIGDPDSVWSRTAPAHVQVDTSSARIFPNKAATLLMAWLVERDGTERTSNIAREIRLSNGFYYEGFAGALGLMNVLPGTTPYNDLYNQALNAGVVTSQQEFDSFYDAVMSVESSLISGLGGPVIVPIDYQKLMSAGDTRQGAVSPERRLDTTLRHETVHQVLGDDVYYSMKRDIVAALQELLVREPDGFLARFLNTVRSKGATSYRNGDLYYIAEEVLAHGTDMRSVSSGLGVDTEAELDDFVRTYGKILDVVRGWGESNNTDIYGTLTQLLDSNFEERLEAIRNGEAKSQEFDRRLKGDGGPGRRGEVSGTQRSATEANDVKLSADRSGSVSDWRGSGPKRIHSGRVVTAPSSLPISSEMRDSGHVAFMIRMPDGTMPMSYSAKDLPPFDNSHLGEKNLLDLTEDANARAAFSRMPLNEFQEWARKKGYHGVFGVDAGLGEQNRYVGVLFKQPETAPSPAPEVLARAERESARISANLEDVKKITATTPRFSIDRNVNLVLTPEQITQNYVSLQTGYGAYHFSRSESTDFTTDLRWMPDAPATGIVDSGDSMTFHVNRNLMLAMSQYMSVGSYPDDDSLEGLSFHNLDIFSAMVVSNINTTKVVRPMLYDRYKAQLPGLYRFLEMATGRTTTQLLDIHKMSPTDKFLKSVNEKRAFVVARHKVGMDLSSSVFTSIHEGTHRNVFNGLGPNVITEFTKDWSTSPLMDGSVLYVMDKMQKFGDPIYGGDVVNGNFGKVINEYLAHATSASSTLALGIDYFNNQDDRAAFADGYGKIITFIANSIDSSTAEDIATFLDPVVAQDVFTIYGNQLPIVGKARRDSQTYPVQPFFSMDRGAVGEGDEGTGIERREISEVTRLESSWERRVRKWSTLLVDGVPFEQADLPEWVRGQFNELKAFRDPDAIELFKSKGLEKAKRNIEAWEAKIAGLKKNPWWTSHNPDQGPPTDLFNNWSPEGWAKHLEELKQQHLEQIPELERDLKKFKEAAAWFASGARVDMVFEADAVSASPTLEPISFEEAMRNRQTGTVMVPKDFDFEEEARFLEAKNITPKFSLDRNSDEVQKAIVESFAKSVELVRSQTLQSQPAPITSMFSSTARRLAELESRPKVADRTILINGKSWEDSDLPQGVRDTLGQVMGTTEALNAPKLRKILLDKYSGLAELAQGTSDRIRAQINSPAEYVSSGSTRNIYYNRPYRGQVIEITQGPDAGKFILETTNDEEVKGLNGKEVASAQEGLNLIANALLAKSEDNLKRYRDSIAWAKTNFDVSEIVPESALPDEMLGGPRFSSDRGLIADTFYSAVERLEGVPSNKKATGREWMGVLPKVPGIKTSEMSWIGMDVFLKENLDKVLTTSDIKNFARENRVDITVTSVQGVYDEWSMGLLDSSAEATRKGYTRWSQYTLLGPVEEHYEGIVTAKYPIRGKMGGKNFNENDLPSHLKLMNVNGWERDAKGRIFDSDNNARRIRGWIVGDSPLHVDKVFADKQEALNYYFKNAIPVAQESPQGHYPDYPNIIGRYRGNIRVDADGNRVFHIEELQSEGAKIAGKKGLDYPFKKNWVEVSFKAALKKAAELGASHVTWTSGENQTDRYMLDYNSSQARFFEKIYDKDLPAFIKKYLGKYNVEIGSSKLVIANAGGAKVLKTVPSIKIPQELVDSVLNVGQPMFSSDRGGERADLSADSGFYSNLETILDGYEPIYGAPLNKTIPAKQTGEDWLNFLSGIRGVKEAELRYSGLKQLLTSKSNETISLDDLRDFVKSNRVTVIQKYNPRWSRNYDLITPGETSTLYDLYLTVPAMFEGRTSGKNWKEEDLPSNARLVSVTLMGGDTRWQVEQRVWNESRNLLGPWQVQGSPYTDPQVALNEFMSRFVLNFEDNVHWNDSNVVLHVRANTRIAPDGVRVMHIEEVQSDLSQKLRGSNTLDPMLLHKIADLAVELDGVMKSAESLTNAYGLSVQAVSEKDSPDQLTWDFLESNLLSAVPDDVKNGLRDLEIADLGNTETWAAFAKEESSGLPIALVAARLLQNPHQTYMELTQLRNYRSEFASKYSQMSAMNEFLDSYWSDDKFVDSPFKQNWKEVAFKKALHEAVQSGARRVTWTTGAQQVERNSSALRQAVDEIEYVKDPAVNESRLAELEVQRQNLKNEWEDLNIELGKSYAFASGKSASELAAERANILDRQTQVQKDLIKVSTEYTDLLYRSGTVLLKATKNGSVVFEDRVKLEGTTDLRGQKVTLDSIIGSKLAREIRESDKPGKVSGDELTLGGEFYHKIYDNDLVKFAKSYGAEWGAVVGTSEIYTKPPQEMFGSPNIPGETIQVHSMEIPKEMAQSIKSFGVPMFSSQRSSTPADTIQQEIDANTVYAKEGYELTPDDFRDIIENRNCVIFSAKKDDMTQEQQIAAHEELKAYLRLFNMRFVEVMGVYGSKERSVVVYGPNSNTDIFEYLALEVFNQESLIHVNGGQNKLIFKDKVIVGSGSVFGTDAEPETPTKDATYAVLGGQPVSFNLNFDQTEDRPAKDYSAAKTQVNQMLNMAAIGHKMIRVDQAGEKVASLISTATGEVIPDGSAISTVDNGFQRHGKFVQNNDVLEGLTSEEIKALNIVGGFKYIEFDDAKIGAELEKKLGTMAKTQVIQSLDFAINQKRKSLKAEPGKKSEGTRALTDSEITKIVTKLTSIVGGYNVKPAEYADKYSDLVIKYKADGIATSQMDKMLDMAKLRLEKDFKIASYDKLFANAKKHLGKLPVFANYQGSATYGGKLGTKAFAEYRFIEAQHKWSKKRDKLGNELTTNATSYQGWEYENMLMERVVKDLNILGVDIRRPIDPGLPKTDPKQREYYKQMALWDATRMPVFQNHIFNTLDYYLKDNGRALHNWNELFFEKFGYMLSDLAGANRKEFATHAGQAFFSLIIAVSSRQAKVPDNLKLGWNIANILFDMGRKLDLNGKTFPMIANPDFKGDESMSDSLRLARTELMKLNLSYMGWYKQGSVEAQKYLEEQKKSGVKKESLIKAAHEIDPTIKKDSFGGTNRFVYIPGLHAEAQAAGELRWFAAGIHKPSPARPDKTIAMDIFGEKVGSFAANLLGNFQAVTVDRWMHLYAMIMTGGLFTGTYDSISGRSSLKEYGEVATYKVIDSEGKEQTRSDYDFVSQAVQLATDKYNRSRNTNLTTAQVQSILWTQIMTTIGPMTEKGRMSGATDFFTEKEAGILGTEISNYSPSEIARRLEEGSLESELSEHLVKFRDEHYLWMNAVKSGPNRATAFSSNRQDSFEAQEEAKSLTEEKLVNADAEAWEALARRMVRNGILADSEVSAIKALAAKGDTKALQNYVLGLNRQSPLELLVNVTRVSLLLGFRNIAKNMGGNTLRQVMEELTRIPASVLDVVLVSMNKALGGTNFDRSVWSVATNPQQTLKAYKEALGKGLKEGGVEFIEVLRGMDPGIVFEHPALFRERTTGWKFLKPLEIFEKYGWRFQGAMDRPFNKAAFHRTLAELQYMRMKIENDNGNEITYEDAEEYLTGMDYQLAEQYALYATFQENNPIASKYYQLVDGLPPTFRAIITNITKFVKTPLNVVDYTLDFTGFWPIIKLAVREYNTEDWVNWKRTAKKVLDTPQDRKILSMAISKGLFGTVMLHIGFRLAESGLLSGFFDREEKKEEEQMEAKGTSFGKLNVGGVSVDISWLSPNGFYLMAGAAMFDSYRKYEEKLAQLKDDLALARDEQDEEKIAKIEQDIAKHEKTSPGEESFSRIIKNIALQTPFLRQLDDMKTAYDQNRLLSGLTERWVSPETFVPAIVKEITGTMDDSERVVADDSVLSKMRDRIQKNLPTIPGVSDLGAGIQETGIPGISGFGKILTGRESMPVKYDMMGNPVQNPLSINPFKPTSISDDQLVKELDRFNISITKPEGLTSLQVNQLRFEKGKYFEPLLKNIVESDDYRGLKDAQRKKVLEAAIRAITNNSKDEPAKRLSDQDLAFNISLLAARENFKDKVRNSPESLLQPMTLTDKRVLLAFNGADLPARIAISDILSDIKKNADLSRFVNDKFQYEMLVSDKTLRDEAESNLAEFKAQPTGTLIRWWAEDKRFETSRNRTNARRSELAKEGKSKEEIEKIMRREASKRGAVTRRKLKNFTKVEVTR